MSSWCQVGRVTRQKKYRPGMKYVSENVLRESGKMFVDCCKLIFITTFVTNRFNYAYLKDDNVLMAVAGIVCYFIGVSLIRYADKMANQKEMQLRKNK